MESEAQIIAGHFVTIETVLHTVVTCFNTQFKKKVSKKIETPGKQYNHTKDVVKVPGNIYININLSILYIKD